VPETRHSSGGRRRDANLLGTYHHISKSNRLLRISDYTHHHKLELVLILTFFPGSWDESFSLANAVVAQMTLDEKIGVVKGVGNFNSRCVGNNSPVTRLGIPSICMMDGPAGWVTKNGRNNWTCTDKFVKYIVGWELCKMSLGSLLASTLPLLSLAVSWMHEVSHLEKNSVEKESSECPDITLLIFWLEWFVVCIWDLPWILPAPLKLDVIGNREYRLFIWRNYSIDIGDTFRFGPDPYLNGEGAYETIMGVQSVGVQACAKHFVANNQEHWRYGLSADVDDRPMQEIYMYPFYRSVDVCTHLYVSLFLNLCDKIILTYRLPG
jgi:beta-glucosidase